MQKSTNGEIKHRFSQDDDEKLSCEAFKRVSGVFVRVCFHSVTLISGVTVKKLLLLVTITTRPLLNLEAWFPWG